MPENTVGATLLYPTTGLVLGKDNSQEERVAAALAKVYGGPRFGVCDGTKDQARINAVIHSMTSGETRIRDSDYNTDDVIYLPYSNTSLVGEGEEGTNILYTGSDYAVRVQNANVATPETPDGSLSFFNRLEKFSIDLENATGGGIMFRRACNSAIRNMKVRKLPANKYGIEQQRSVYCEISNVNINGQGVDPYDNSSVGIHTSDNCNLCRYNLVSVSYCHYGMVIKSPEICRITDSAFELCGVGLHIYGGESRHVNTKVDSTYFENNADTDIRVGGEDDGEGGEYTLSVVIIDNCFFNGTSTAEYGVWLGKNVDYVVISNCYFMSHNTAGIYVDSGFTGRIIEFNNNFENETTGIDDQVGAVISGARAVSHQYRANFVELIFDEAAQDGRLNTTESMQYNVGSGEAHKVLVNDVETGRFTDAGLQLASGMVLNGAGTGANGIVMKNLKNAAASALSGTQKDIEIDIGGTPYYFTVYPTKA